MADPLWMAKNNLTSVTLNTSEGDTLMIDRLEAFGPVGQTILVCLYSLTTFLAFTGNTLVILVELYGKRSARNLQKFLINLAISDLLLGVLSAPFAYTDFMLGRWIFHPLLCPVAQFVQLMSVLVSTYTLTFIGIERYFATLHPLSSTNTWLRSHCNLVLLIGWILGLLLASISVRNIQVMEFSFQNETYNDCRHWVGFSEQDMQIYVSASFVLTFVLPMTFLTISYGAIGRRLLRAQQHWCSFKQSVPFSLHSVSRTHNSLNSNCSLNGGLSSRNCNSIANGNLESNSISDGHSGSHHNKNNTFVRSKPSRQSIKRNNQMHTIVKVGRTKSNVSVDSFGSKSGNQRPKLVKLYASQLQNSQESGKNGEPGSSKVLIRFDRRNAEFLNKMRVFRLLVAVLVLFIICWLPIKIFMLVLAFNPSIVNLNSITSYYAYYVLYFLCHLLSMSNSFTNPVLYCFMSKSFRADLIDLFVCICTKFQQSQRPGATSVHQRSNPPLTPQTYKHGQQHFFNQSFYHVANNHVANMENTQAAIIDNNVKLVTNKENKSESKERIKMTDRSHSSRPASSCSSGASDTLRSNRSLHSKLSRHSSHSHSSKHSHSIFDDLHTSKSFQHDPL